MLFEFWEDLPRLPIIPPIFQLQFILFEAQRGNPEQHACILLARYVGLMELNLLKNQGVANEFGTKDNGEPRVEIEETIQYNGSNTLDDEIEKAFWIPIKSVVFSE